MKKVTALQLLLQADWRSLVHCLHAPPPPITHAGPDLATCYHDRVSKFQNTPGHKAAATRATELFHRTRLHLYNTFNTTTHKNIHTHTIYRVLHHPEQRAPVFCRHPSKPLRSHWRQHFSMSRRAEMDAFLSFSHPRETF